jgi:hypothetical protein
MEIDIQTTSQNSFTVNNKEVYADQEGCIRFSTPLTELEKEAFLNHYRTHYLKLYKNTSTENRVAVELIRYYQQKDKLKEQEKDYNNPISFVNLMTFYNEKIKSLKKQLYELNPKRLQAIERQRANDITVNGAEQIQA